jgi:hypothetical protein
MVGAKLSREFRFVLPPSNRHDLESHVPRILDAQVPEPANPQDPDDLARFGGGIAQCAECGEAGT